MNKVTVKHHPGGKEYWFEVPDEFVSRVKPSVTVKCDTSRGKTTGVVTRNVTGDGEYMPTRKIIGVKDVLKIKVNRILIPWSFTMTRPAKEKLISRINEYYDTGNFDTEIVIDQGRVLRDGYTAYLVARMLGLKYLRVKKISTPFCIE